MQQQAVYDSEAEDALTKRFENSGLLKCMRPASARVAQQCLSQYPRALLQCWRVSVQCQCDQLNHI